MPPDEESQDVLSSQAQEESQLVEPAEARRRLPGFPRVSRSDVLVAVLIVVALATGAYFRFTGQNWDDYTHLHPDERSRIEPFLPIDVRPH